MHDKRNILEFSKITINCYKDTTLYKVSYLKSKLRSISVSV